MKILLTGPVTGFVFLLAITTIPMTIGAQTSNLPDKTPNGEVPATQVKISPGALPTPNAEYGEGKSKPSCIRADRDFRKKFTDGVGVTWYDLADGYRARLIYNGADTWVDYNRKGNWIHTIRTYNEKKMSTSLRHTVKRVYYDYSIKLIQEIELPDDTVVYVIHLESDKELIDLRVVEDEMNVLGKYVRSE
jgi:ribosomal protein L25 (general stress protein Ctc)